MTVQGTASAATTNVAIPTHQIGDLLFVFTFRANNTVPTKPTAAGTVPNWTVAQAAGANTLSLSSAWFVATAANHTTGTWTGATQIIVLVLRPEPGRRLTVATSSTGNSSATQTVVYPALTLTVLTGASWGVRCGARGTADSEMANPPATWTNQIVQPAGASALMTVHTRDHLIANPTLDTVTTTGTNATYRAHTLEVTEVGQPTAMIV